MRHQTRFLRTSCTPLLAANMAKRERQAKSGEFISTVADVSGSWFILAHNITEIDELEVSKDRLEAVERCTARAKGAVARASSLSSSV